MDLAQFITRYGGVYEKSPWVAAQAYDLIPTGHDDVAIVTDCMRRVVDSADDGQKLALLRAHPELVGKLALAGKLTAESTAEQRGLGLTNARWTKLPNLPALTIYTMKNLAFHSLLR